MEADLRVTVLSDGTILIQGTVALRIVAPTRLDEELSEGASKAAIGFAPNPAPEDPVGGSNYV